MTGKERILKAIKREKTDVRPVWFMRQAGRYLKEYRKLREKYSFLYSCKNTELIVEITLQPVRILDVDAAIVFSDILLPVEAMGIKFNIVENKGPVFEKPIEGAEDIEKLKVLEPEKSMSYLGNALRELRKELGDEKALIGFCGAPFTVASYLIEGGHSKNYTKTKIFMHREKLLWHKLMSVLTESFIGYLRFQLKNGADLVQVFDSWAGYLSPSDYREFVKPYNARIFKEISPSISFSTGTSGFLEEVRDAGGNAIGIDWRISIDKAWEIIGYEKSIQGNLDPAVLLLDKDNIEKEIRKIIEKTKNRPGHIFNLGHGIFPQTPPDNVKFTVDRVREISIKINE